MPITVSKSGPYYSSGEISFSSLRSNFKESSSGQISLSEYVRDTRTSSRNPVIPDSTENTNIPTSTSGGISLSNFRNSVKRYYANQTGTDTNQSNSLEPGLRMGLYKSDGTGIDWSGGGTSGPDGFNGGVSNANYGKNIQKIINIYGISGSYWQNMPAAQLAPQPTVVNTTINVYGQIYGYGGRGGGTDGQFPISGEAGGIALNVDSSGAINLVIDVKSSAQIYGGGGGGEKGNTGARGLSGTCRFERRVENCGNCPSCPSGWDHGGCWSGNACDRRQECNWWGNCWRVDSRWNKFRDCRLQYTVLGGLGGIGGNGGNGRGYTNQSASLSGALGQNGQPGNGCGSTPGQQGGTGGSGGEWGQRGGDTPNTGSGGNAGQAVWGSGYSLTGNINSSTIKGQYR